MKTWLHVFLVLLAIPFTRSSMRADEPNPENRVLVSTDADVLTQDVAGANPGSETAAPDTDRPNPAKLRYRVTPQSTDVRFYGNLRMTAQLENLGDQKVTVFWGDYAYPKMYHFEVTHESGKRLAITREYADERLPGAAVSRYFVSIEPGASAKYDLSLGYLGAANCEHACFLREGKYRVEPSLFISTTDVLDPTTGDTHPVPGAWTGLLKAEPFTITVADGAMPKDYNVCIRGRVIDERGALCANVLVKASHRVISRPSGALGGLRNQQIDQTFTDDQGHFEFVNLPGASPSFELEALSEDHPPGRAAVLNEPAPDGSPKVFEAEIRLTDGITVVGRVVDSAGQPCMDASFYFSGFPRQTLTDKNGRFKMMGVSPAAEFLASLSRRGFVETTAKASRAIATDGTWTITLLRESEQSVSGRVGFASGQPSAGLKLTFHLTPTEPATVKSGPARFESTAKVDAEGRFQLVLSRNEPFDVVAFASPDMKDRGTTLPIWRQPFGRVSPRQQDVDLVFDDRHSLHVRVSPKNEVRESMQFRISCVLLDSDGRGQSQAQGTLNPGGGDVEFSRLCPGKYRVDLDTSPFESVRQTQEVELALDGQRPPTIEFQPELKIGRIQGRLLNAEGQAISFGKVLMEGPLGSQWLQLDSIGNFEAIAPAGEVRLTPRTDDGRTGVLVKSSIKDGQTTDLGRVIWQPAETADAAGWVEGRVLYDDGSPALGAVLSEMMQTQAVAADGSYRWQLHQSKPTIVINLANVDGWPWPDLKRRLAPLSYNSGDSRVEVTVTLKPNETVRRDVILPRKHVSSLVIRNVDAAASSSHAFLRTVPYSSQGANDVPAEPGSEELQFVQSSYSKVEPDNSKVFTGVPLGRCIVAFNYYPDFARDAYLVEVTNAVRPAELTIDRREFGQIELGVAGTDGKLRSNVGLKLMKLLAGQKVQIFDSQKRPKDIPLKQLSVTDEGAMIIRDLSAGSYELTASDGELSKTIAVKISPRDRTLLDMKIADFEKAIP